ncbi:alpha-amylase, partial [Leptolyngbya sp. FACHB-36]|uniref:alpha-amylase family glycosyl hydrolase n=1 Tax=Leptolyngbya sp. FACHB-36 TaxID=2692808 RepID=UPI001681550E
MPLTEFKLFAPYNNAASLVGSFSDWNDIPMEKGDDGYFRVKVDLEDGIYRYRFRVQSKSWFLKPDQLVEINDPYMTEMDKESNTGIVHVKAGEQVRDTYIWKHDDKPLPANHELIVYEMHVSDFVGGEIGKRDKFQRITEKLDYLAELGINAIELMPITEYAGDYRWGYLVRYYFAPESSYGPPEDLKHFIDECHARGIRLILDGIYNHTDDKSPLLYIDRDYWYYHDKHYPEDPANFWGPELNYEVYDEKLDIRPAWSFVSDVVRYWIQEYHIDGIRYDAVRQLGNYEFLGWLLQQANEALAGKPFYHIAEHIPDSSEVVQPKGVFEGCWHESFRFFLKDALLGDNVDLANLKAAIDARQQGYSMTTNVLNYLATHDRQHMIVELGDKGIFGKAAFDRV